MTALEDSLGRRQSPNRSRKSFKTMLKIMQSIRLTMLVKTARAMPLEKVHQSGNATRMVERDHPYLQHSIFPPLHPLPFSIRRSRLRRRLYLKLQTRRPGSDHFSMKHQTFQKYRALANRLSHKSTCTNVLAALGESPYETRASTKTFTSRRTCRVSSQVSRVHRRNRPRLRTVMQEVVVSHEARQQSEVVADHPKS